MHLKISHHRAEWRIISQSRVTYPPIRAEVAGNLLEVIETGEGRLRGDPRPDRWSAAQLQMLMYMFSPDHVGGRGARRTGRGGAARGGREASRSTASALRHRRDFFSALDESGGEHCVFNPSLRPALSASQSPEAGRSRTTAVAIIGGANIDDTYLTDRGPEHWRDLWLRIEGPEVQAARAAISTSLFRWSNRKKSKLRSLRRIVGEYSEWRGPLQWKFSGPLEHAQQLVAEHRPRHRRARERST